MCEIEVTMKGPVTIQFDREIPDNYDHLDAHFAVIDGLLEVMDMDINELRASFDAAKEYSKPGECPKATVGTLVLEDDTIEFHSEDNPLSEIER